MLGKGEYGSVRVLECGKKKFALKETKLGVYPKRIDIVMACLREEAMNCVHKHIIKRYWTRFWDNKFQICMEMGVPVDHADGARLIHDISQGLAFMHSNGFVHRDVKPENIVRVGKVYKLIDFGLSRKMVGYARMTGYMCSRWYRPPELLRLDDYDLHKYDGRCDMWSLGVTAYYLQVGTPLFYGSKEEILQMYSEYEPTGVLKYLICEYEERWTAEKLLKTNDIEIIEGSLSEVPERTGNVGDFARCLLEGNEDIADGYAHERIYSDL